MATYLVTWIPLVVDTRVAVAGSVVAGRHAVDSVNSRMWDFFSNEIILREMQWEKILQCVQHCRWTWQLSGGAGQVFGDRFRISVAVLWGKQPKAVTMNLAGERRNASHSLAAYFCILQRPLACSIDARFLRAHTSSGVTWAGNSPGLWHLCKICEFCYTLCNILQIWTLIKYNILCKIVISRI